MVRIRRDQAKSASYPQVSCHHFAGLDNKSRFEKKRMGSKSLAQEKIDILKPNILK
jgi:hypothetical protein